MLALGLVETVGLVGALEVADVMLKTADVRLLEKSLADAGLVTITVAGDVAAVQASVEAASASVGRIKGARLVSAHVIPRPDEELWTILKLDPDGRKKAGKANPTTPEFRKDESGERDEACAASEESAGEGEKQPEPDSSESGPRDESVAPEGDIPDEETLKNMGIGALRALAMRENITFNGKLAQAGKKALIQALLQAQSRKS